MARVRVGVRVTCQCVRAMVLSEISGGSTTPRHRTRISVVASGFSLNAMYCLG